MKKEELVKHLDNAAIERDAWIRRNWYYHDALKKLICFLIPTNIQVLEVGSATGELLHAAQPSHGVGIDISPKMVEIAKNKYKNIEWHVDDIENLALRERFDAIIMSDVVGSLDDVVSAFANLNKVSHESTKVVITFYNYLWEPILRLAEFLHFKRKQPLQNWLSPKDVESMLQLTGFEVIKSGNRMILPVYMPLISNFLNRYVGNLPLVRKLGVIQYVVARPIPKEKRDFSVSIVLPCRNEKGNIENAVKRIPQFGTYTELIFVEKGSMDGTYEEIARVANEYAGKKNIKYFQAKIDSKGDKVREAFERAAGDILMILDSDLTMPPEDLPKFYNAIASGRGEFINGSRLVYQLENDSMRIINIFGNKFFSVVFSWLLGQRLKDTLCGTKVLFKKDYEMIAQGRKYFGDFDPFGDFDLLFGAAKLNLKIVEMPIRYRARTYGSTNIQRWRHGWLLIKMVFLAMRKIKFV
ncbi:MAG: glycosyltransferase [Patescibacteria group bacterium]